MGRKVKTRRQRPYDILSTWHELRRQATREKDPQMLGYLLIEISKLLDVLENRVTKLEKKPTRRK
jgi:hypothetical protein